MAGQSKSSSNDVRPSSVAASLKSTSLTSTQARPDVPLKITTHFTQSQLALALAIQKSRPEGVSAIEYYQRLQKRIKTQQNLPNDEHRYVDSSRFWKDQYTTIHTEKKILEDKVHLLEEELRLYRENIEEGASQDLGTQRSLVLRLVTQSHRLSSSNSRKRQALNEAQSWIEDQQREKTMVLTPYDDELLRLSSYILRISRQRKTLEESIKKFKDLSRLEELTKFSHQILLLLNNAISDCYTPPRLLKTNGGETQTLLILQHLSHQIIISFCSCFEAFNAICCTIPGRVKKQDLVYRMVMFFNKSLNLLQTIGNFQAKHEETMKQRNLWHKHNGSEEGEYAVNKYLAGVLSSILLNLEWKVGEPGHSELLEGILFSILEHAGRLLSEAVFSEHIATSKAPGNITEDALPTGLKTVRFESRYIVQILHSALGGLSSEKKELVARILGSERELVDPHKNSRSATLLSGGLLEKVRGLVQSTLVKSAVGGKELETLKLPTAMSEEGVYAADVPSGVERYSREWLVEMVWGMVGWDMVV